jgi:AAA15 family ATPase/GTPase
MKLDIQIKNFGKIKDAKLKLRPFTVIAGPNSSGKSFVTKALYSFFNTFSKDQIALSIENDTGVIRSAFEHLEYIAMGYEDDVPDLVNLMPILDKFEGLINKDMDHGVASVQPATLILLCKLISDMKLVYGVVSEKTAKIFDFNWSDNVKFKATRHLLDNLLSMLGQPSNTPFRNEFINGLKDNFQVQRLTELKNFHCKSEDSVIFDFYSDARFSMENENIDYSMTEKMGELFLNINSVVFLESPIYWKIKNALEFTRKERTKYSLRSNSGSGVLTGIPQHFYDLVDLLDTKVKIDDSTANDANIYEAINKEIGGEIEISDSGDIYFKEEKSPRSININNTASGITNIGLLALLLKRHVIAKGSYVFIDEPEVNLHPAWQKVMAETLYKMSCNGINVVIASHSIDMMKAIENIMDEHEHGDVTEHFAINQLSGEGMSINENSPVMKKIASIQADLGQSFYDMVLQSDWQ